MKPLLLGILASTLTFAASSSPGKPVTVHRVSLEGYRIDAMVPRDESPDEGSLIVLFYEAMKEEDHDRFLSGTVWRRVGRLDRIDGEILDNGRIRLRIFLVGEDTEAEKEVHFEFDPPGSSSKPKATPHLMALVSETSGTEKR